MMNYFASILDKISHKVIIELNKKYDDYNQAPFFTKLIYGIDFWCQRLDIASEERDFIIQGVNNDEIKKLIDFIFQESRNETKPWKIPIRFAEIPTIIQIHNEFNQHIEDFLFTIDSSLSPMRLIILLAFGITAIGYFVYKLKEPQPQAKKNPNSDYIPVYNPSSSTILPPISPTITTPVKLTLKQSLILVIPAAQTSIIEGLKIKTKIDYEDGEKLYEATQSLVQANIETLKDQWNTIKQFETQPQEANEYDIYLIKVDLKEAEEGFKPTVDQLERYDAFKKLYDLATNVEVSSRLKMEAASNFDVYIR
ncbi:hypothetical protein VB715_21280 [Crocosphaera sp. UHCC 0190]|uniref:hypothetical protein n=1 Tax=Crocosphaera sp. UHCC 0190 TaxID=3110246 RepID=UPI002B1F43D6|nr:hypothetical protein [Crocosphaera sp. UHCC 0190]MEA5512309.1 hypothetical protein [Crocosphaera sp. UHCC 0190]